MSDGGGSIASTVRSHRVHGTYAISVMCRKRADRIQAQCRALETELETCMADHRRTLDAVRTDTAQLLRENDSLATEVAALRKGAAEMAQERERGDAEKDAVVRELMELVQQQRATLRQNKVLNTTSYSSLITFRRIHCSEDKLGSNSQCWAAVCVSRWERCWRASRFQYHSTNTCL